MKYVIDRFEDKFAICQDMKTEENIDINISNLPKEAREGDIIVNINGIFIIDREETKARKEKIRNKFNTLLKDKK